MRFSQPLSSNKTFGRFLSEAEIPDYSEVTDIGPKDSNFPQNAWGLLDSTYSTILDVKETRGQEMDDLDI